MKKFLSFVIALLLVVAIVPTSVASASDEFRPACRIGDLFTAAYPNHHPSAFVNHEGDIEIGGIVAVCAPGIGYAFKYEPKRATVFPYATFRFYSSGYSIQIRPLTRKTEFFPGERGASDIIAKNNVGFKIVLPAEVKDQLSLYEYSDSEYISAAMLILASPELYGKG